MQPSKAAVNFIKEASTDEQTVMMLILKSRDQTLQASRMQQKHFHLRIELLNQKWKG